jgi:hypothetical protein
MNYIIPVIITSILVIVWLQYPEFNKKENKKLPTNQKVFNIVKIPIILICFISIIYLLCNNKNMNINNKAFIMNTNPRVYMNMPHF